MRLTPKTREIICRTTREVFGEAARVRLFGSRVDDSARGGDIDLLVELTDREPQARKKSLTLAARLQMQLEGQPGAGAAALEKNVPKYASGHRERIDGKDYTKGLTREWIRRHGRQAAGIRKVSPGSTAIPPCTEIRSPGNACSQGLSR